MTVKTDRSSAVTKTVADIAVANQLYQFIMLPSDSTYSGSYLAPVKICITLQDRSHLRSINDIRLRSATFLVVLPSLYELVD